jgi:hypothetical protein
MLSTSVTPTMAAAGLPLEEILAATPLPEDTLCVYAAGATAVGWGHARSDLDVYVVSRSRPRVAWDHLAETGVDVEHDDAVVPRLSPLVDGVQAEIEYWQAEQVDAVFARFFDVHWAAGIREDPPFTDADIEFAHRLRTGLPLAGADWLETLRSSIDWRGLERVLVRRRMDAADGYLDEALGLLERGDEASAALSAHVAFGYVVDALTIQAGVLSVKAKWRARRVAELEPAELPWDDYWSVETFRRYEPERGRAWVEAVVGRCRALMLEVETG